MARTNSARGILIDVVAAQIAGERNAGIFNDEPLISRAADIANGITGATGNAGPARYLAGVMENRNGDAERRLVIAIRRQIERIEYRHRQELRNEAYEQEQAERAARLAAEGK